MQLVIGKDMWLDAASADLVLVTTNSTLNLRDELVMGRGAALEAKRLWPDLPGYLGARLVERCLAGSLYGLQAGPLRTFYGVGSFRVGAFQVKLHFADDANLQIIAVSCRQLCLVAPFFEKVIMNYPGIGNGRLAVERVQQVIRQLPDNVHVYSIEGTA